MNAPHTFKRKRPPQNGRGIHQPWNNSRPYILFLFAILLMVGMTHASSGEPATQKELDCMIYITPDFQVLPASSFSLQEGLAVYEWMCSGHMAGVIRRGDGYEVTIRHDNGTLETRYFSEFSNGQPFCTPAPGCKDWAYAFDEEEVDQARQYYGQEISYLDLIKAVAPEEYENMDYLARAEGAYRIVQWPDDPEEFVAPWTIGYSHCSIRSHYQPAEVGSLFPDLSSEPIGRTSREGTGWKIEVVIQEPKDQYGNHYTSMLDFYRVQYPDVYASLSSSERRELGLKPPRVGYVNIMTTPDREQQEILRTIWGTDLSNEEYYTLLWPDLWDALPEWFRESAWAGEPYRWREPDTEHHSVVPNDYILPEDRLPPSSNLPGKQVAAPAKETKEEIGDVSLNLLTLKTPNRRISPDSRLTKPSIPALSSLRTGTESSGFTMNEIRDMQSVKESLSQVSERFTVNTPAKSASLKASVARTCASCGVRR